MKRSFLTLFTLCVLAGNLCAQIPNGYYNDATGKRGDELKVALHDIIDDHTTISYQQIWNAFWSTDNKGNNVVWDMYSDGANYIYNYTNGNDQCGEYEQEGDCYNREHSWPKSWFSGNEQAVPGRDLHHIFPTDGFVNAQRSSFPYGEVSNASWTSQNGSKLGTCKSSLGYTGTVFEPIDEYKGDFARALMYMSVRYYGEDSDWGSSGMTNKSVIKEWAIQMLMRWSEQDPVSEKEIARNNVVYGIQHNRNPFIDHPEYARAIWDPDWNGVEYNISYASVQHGSISGPSTAVEGTMVTLTATPSQGYVLGSWMVYKTGDQTTTVSVSENGTFTMPSFNVTISATFEQNSTYYTITQGSMSHGSITVSATSAQSGTTITLSNTPASGYVLYSYYVYKTADINTIVYSGTGNTFTMPAYDVTVLASFVQPTSYSYVKVTSAPADWSGEYILVYENSATEGYVWTGVDAANCYTEKTITDNAIADGNMVSITIATMNDGYSIKVNGGTNNGKYISGSSSSNTISFGTSAKSNTIEFESDGIKIISNTSVMRYNDNSNDNRFRYYKSSTYTSQQPVQLYKKTGISSTPTHTIQFNPNGGSQSSYTQTINEFEPTTLQANTFTRENYAFDSWNTATNGTGITYFDGATVTLLNDLTLYAQWNQIFTITLATIENGSVTVSQNQAVEGDLISLTATPSTGYEFDHWNVTDAENNIIPVTENQFEMPASNVTISAVFVYVGQPFAQQYHLVTDINQLVAGRTYLIVNTVAGQALSTTQNNNNRSGVTVTITNGVISSIGSAVCELTLGGSTNAWTFFDANWGDNGGYLYAASSSNNYLKTQTTNDENGQWSIEVTSNGTATIVAQGTNTRNNLRYNPNNNNPIFSCYSSTNNLSKVELYIRSEEYEHTESETIAHLYTFDKHTVQSGASLTVSGAATCNDASHLVIEDGAQFIHHSDGVQATMKKTIEAYTEDGGWYTIAVPCTSYVPAGTMIDNDYDLYAYNEGGPLEWINYKAGAFNLMAVDGYLFAHNPASTLRITGTLNSGSFTQQVDLGYANSNNDIKGFNLLGNPTAHDINFTKTANVSDGYYYLNHSEAWVYTPSTTVPVGRGFMVKANAENQSVTLNPQSKGDENPKEDQYLCIGVGEAKTYVKLNEGVSMPMMDLKGKHSQLYFLNGSHPYIMLVRNEANAMNLCFEARSNGKQTLAVNFQGIDLDYLHLIDNITGANIDLLQTSEYTFDAKTTDYASRFKLVFASAYNDPDDANEPFAYFNGIDWCIQNEGMATIQLIDMTGRVIREEAINGNAKFSTTDCTSGIYLLRLVGNNTVNTKKITIR